MEHRHSLTAVIERDGNSYISFCPEFDIACRADSVDKARKCLVDAVERFLETASPAEIKARFHEEVIVTKLDVSFWNADVCVGNGKPGKPIEARVF
jgi:hypothetical protein